MKKINIINRTCNSEANIADKQYSIAEQIIRVS